MVAETLVRSTINAEALSPPVIVMIHLFPGPVMTLYSEMVVSLHSQIRLAITGLQKALCQCYTCGHT